MFSIGVIVFQIRNCFYRIFQFHPFTRCQIDIREHILGHGISCCLYAKCLVTYLAASIAWADAHNCHICRMCFVFTPVQQFASVVDRQMFQCVRAVVGELHAIGDVLLCGVHPVIDNRLFHAILAQVFAYANCCLVVITVDVSGVDHVCLTVNGGFNGDRYHFAGSQFEIAGNARSSLELCQCQLAGQRCFCQIVGGSRQIAGHGNRLEGCTSRYSIFQLADNACGSAVAVVQLQGVFHRSGCIFCKAFRTDALGEVHICRSVFSGKGGGLVAVAGGRCVHNRFRIRIDLHRNGNNHSGIFGNRCICCRNRVAADGDARSCQRL